jgi:uridine kinase
MRGVALNSGVHIAASKIKDLRQQEDVVIVSISGGSGSGKGYFIEKLKKKLKNKVSIVHMDNYYREIQGPVEKINHDHPRTLRMKLFQEHLALLRRGETVCIPKYSFKKHKAIGCKYQKGKHVIILDGLFSFYNQRLRKLADYTIYIDVPDKVRLKRRIIRDAKERSETPEQTKEKWRRTVLPMHKKFVAPQKKEAKLVVKNY